MLNHLRNELQNILSGKSQIGDGAIIQSIACYLSNGSPASSASENEKHYKKQETKRLEDYISEKGYWSENIDFSQYISEGAEQKVYLKNCNHVLKLNDAI